jgi:hypothetical protein
MSNEKKQERYDARNTLATSGSDGDSESREWKHLLQKTQCPEADHSTVASGAPRQDAKRQIGVISATFLIFNRMIGTGIFATPSGILKSTGSVGLALFMWVAGMLIAAAGMAVSDIVLWVRLRD